MVAFNLVILLIATVVIYHYYVSSGLSFLTRNHLFLLVLFAVPYTTMFLVSFKMPMRHAYGHTKFSTHIYPQNGGQKGREDEVCINKASVDNTFTYCFGHVYTKNKDRCKVKEGGPDHGSKW